MAERKPIPKKIRFEVLKRDKFTCQYCGKSAPDVVLEIDHIKPVSKGGDNDILNLVTSCVDCNRGKTNVELSDDSAVKKQQRQLQELAERKEQLEMMLEWRSSLNDLENYYVESVADVFSKRTDWDVTNSGKAEIRRWIKRFGFDEVIVSCDISLDTYYDGSVKGFDRAFDKVAGICFNRKRDSDEKRKESYAEYAVNVALNNGIASQTNLKTIREYFLFYVKTEDDFQKAKVFLDGSRNWADFWTKMETVFKNDYWG